MEEPQFASTLTDADYYLFLAFWMLWLMLTAALLSSDEGFIDFHGPAKLVCLRFLHCCSDSVAQIPRGLIGNAQCLLDLVGAHALLGFTKQVDAKEPLPKREVGVIQNRSSSHRELIAAIVAIELVALCDLPRRR